MVIITPLYQLRVAYGRWSSSYMSKRGYLKVGSWGSSDSIVSDYGLDDRDKIPAGTKDFSFGLCVHTGSEVHPASYPVVTGGSFPGVKARPGLDTDHSPHLVPRSRMSRGYISFPPKRFHGV
jgi:hypothetical protein